MGGRLRGRTAPRVTRTTILLITNGEKTEKSYLEGIRRRVPRDANLSITVKGENGKEPETIVRNLTRSQGGLDEYDEVWIVVVHNDASRLVEVGQQLLVVVFCGQEVLEAFVFFGQPHETVAISDDLGVSDQRRHFLETRRKAVELLKDGVIG